MLQIIDRKVLYETNIYLKYQIASIQRAYWDDDYNKSEFDLLDCKATKPNFINEMILNVYPKSYRSIYKNLYLALNYAFKLNDISSLYFIGLFNSPFLAQKNSYPPVKAALEYFRNQGFNESFSAGIQIKRDELSILLKHIFWIIRCNASIPEIYFCIDELPIVANICKYGNIHLTIYDYEYAFYIEKNMPNYIRQVKQCANLSSNINDSIPGKQIII